MFELNPIIEKLPKHLLDLVIEQPYKEYTAQDHAIWRYVMRQNIDYLKEVAHKSYLQGIQQTGVSFGAIPHMYGMNRILQEIGWAAVAVDGFIPPSAFMEFQAYKVLVIAADIRPIDQINYTPAPDIIHEAAGHAPIIANSEYAEYLRLFGYYGSKAIPSKKDADLYKAIRHLSILKADPYSPKDSIEKAENEIRFVESTINARSELAKIRNLHWWTVEYGLIGNIYNPKIYGAGLLSSIGESYHALQDSVLKLPYSLDAENYNFDITRMQPQLFVTPSFQYLTEVLEKFVDLMAFRTGGIDGIKKAINSEQISCFCLDTGIQISGKISEYIENDGKLIFVKTTGPTSISYNNTQLETHHKEYHADGFSTPIGKLKDITEDITQMNNYQLDDIGLVKDKMSVLEWESGIQLSGRFYSLLRKDGKNVLFSFEECTIIYQDQILFKPEWGSFDLALGVEIKAVSNGPADPDAYGNRIAAPTEKTHKITHTSEAKKLHDFYQITRDYMQEEFSLQDISTHWEKAMLDFPNEWLLHLEIYEVLKSKTSSEILNKVYKNLMRISESDPTIAKLIRDGIKIIS